MTSGRPAIVDRLREATRELHAEIDAEAAVVDGGRARYLWFVSKLYGFHAPLEPRLASALAGSAGALGLELAARRRAHLFEPDLLHLGVDPGRLPSCAALPEVGSTARALGALYVMEGSTLGGAFLLSRLGPVLGIAPGAGASGIAPHGARLREMWLGYGAAVDRFVAASPREEQELIAGARETFACINAWMRVPAAVVAPPGARDVPRDEGEPHQPRS